MQMSHVREKTGRDGTLSLRIPLGVPDSEFDVVVVVQPAAFASTSVVGSWPPGYFDLAGSIPDDTFVRPPQGGLK